MEITSLCDITPFASQDTFALLMMAIGATGVMSIFSNLGALASPHCRCYPPGACVATEALHPVLLLLLAAPERVLAFTGAASRGDFATAHKVHSENVQRRT